MSRLRGLLRSWRNWVCALALAVAAKPIAWLPELLAGPDPELAAVLRLIRDGRDAFLPGGPLDAWGRPWRFYLADWEGGFASSGEEMRDGWRDRELPRLLLVDDRFYAYFLGENGIDETGRGDDEFFFRGPGQEHQACDVCGPCSLGPDGIDQIRGARQGHRSPCDDVIVDRPAVRAARRIVELVRVAGLALVWVVMANRFATVPGRERWLTAARLLLFSAPLLAAGALGAWTLTPWLESRVTAAPLLVPPAVALQLTGVAGVVTLVAFLRSQRRFWAAEPG